MSKKNTGLRATRPTRDNYAESQVWRGREDLSEDLLGQVGPLEEGDGFGSTNPAIAVQIRPLEERFELVHARRAQRSHTDCKGKSAANPIQWRRMAVGQIEEWGIRRGRQGGERDPVSENVLRAQVETSVPFFFLGVHFLFYHLIFHNFIFISIFLLR